MGAIMLILAITEGEDEGLVLRGWPRDPWASAFRSIYLYGLSSCEISGSAGRRTRSMIINFFMPLFLEVVLRRFYNDWHLFHDADVHSPCKLFLCLLSPI